MITNSDLKKILDAIAKYGKKDSQLQKARTPLTGKEYMSIIQDGINKIVTLGDMYESLDFPFGFEIVEDHTAIENPDPKKVYREQGENQYTDYMYQNDAWEKLAEFNFPGIDSEPIEGSKNLVESDGIFQFKNSIFEENRQMVNSIMENYKPVEIHGNVNNAADEEDLASVNVEGTDVLRFKDKVYNPLTYSGLGRKILRKNIVNGVNTLTQSMMSDANTIYIIQYDFTLGEDITVPANCILEFDGGSISGNGTGKDTITGNNTSINAGLVSIFDGITISGTWIISDIYSDWFADITQDNKLNNLFNLTNNSINNKILIDSGNYIASISVSSGSAFLLQEKCNIDIILFGHIILTPNSFDVYNIFHFNKCHDIRLSGNGIIEGDRDNHTYSGGTHEWGHCIRINSCYNIDISDLTIKKSTGDGLNIGKLSENTEYSHNIQVHDLVIDNTRRNGLVIGNAYNIIIDNIIIQNISGISPQAAIDIEADSGTIYNVTISNIHIRECVNGISSYLVGTEAGVYENINIKNIFIESVDGSAISINNIKNCIIENVCADGLTVGSVISVSRGSFAKFVNVRLKNIIGSLIYQTFNAEIEIEDSVMETSGGLLAQSNESAGKLQFQNCALTFDSINNSDNYYNHIECYGCSINGKFNKKIKNSIFDKCAIATNLFGVNQTGKCDNITVLDSTIRFSGGYVDNLNVRNCIINLTTAFIIRNSVGIKIKKCIINANTGDSYNTLMYFIASSNVFVEECEFFDKTSESTLKYNIIASNCQNVNYINNKYVAGIRDIFNFDGTTGVITQQDKIYPGYGDSRPIFNSQKQFSIIGFQFFDTSLTPAKLILWNGTAWVDATGATV